MENRNAIGWWKKVVLENYANFEGRARRSEYWWFVLINMIISFVIGFVFGLLAGVLESPAIAMVGNIYSLAVLVPSLAVGVRRIHDVGKSGWFILIPIYNLILFFTEGDKGPNEYGPDPKGGDFDIDKIGA